MKTQLNEDYLSDLNDPKRKGVGVTSQTYQSPELAGARMRDVVRTARGVTISQHKSEELWNNLLKDALATLEEVALLVPPLAEEWDHNNMYSECESIFSKDLNDTQEDIRNLTKEGRFLALIDFDRWMLRLIMAVARRLQGVLKAPIQELGIAQKIVNLMIKDYWSLGNIHPSVHGLLHIPLDTRSLMHIRMERNAIWKSWTKVKLNPNALCEYLKIQITVRQYFRNVTPFHSTMELDQVWWKLLKLS
jgi:hypothetical protein